MFQLPELRAQHDAAIREAYTCHDLDLQELITGAQKQWEEHDKTPAPNLALMTKADIHGRQSEQRFR